MYREAGSNTDDVGVFYYENSRGNNAVIKFYENMDSLINSERVRVVFDNDNIFFKEDSTKGLKLANGKIQLWSFAEHCKNWEGIYPLKYDVKEGCYKISREDRKEYNKDRLPSRRGIPVNYTKHFGERVSNSEKNTDTESTDTQVLEMSNVKCEGDLSTSEKVLLSVLLDKSVALIDKGEYDKVKAVMITMRSLIEP